MLLPAAVYVAKGRGYREFESNLLRNANKYSPTGSRIDVGLRQDGEQALLWVADTGVGIPSDHLDTIFELFARLPGGAQQPGLGIGLPLVKRLVQLHGGDIEAMGDGPGCGATFLVRIPLQTRSSSK